jgi:hypothetical protein
MAGVLMDSGHADEALVHWEQALALFEKNGDVHGKAVVLTSMAGACAPKRARSLSVQAVRELSRIGSWSYLPIAIANLGASDASAAVSCAAQAFWLCVNVEVAVNELIDVAAFCFGKLGSAFELSPRIAVATLWLVETRGRKHAEIERFRQSAADMLAACIKTRNIDLAQRSAWLAREGLLLPSQFLQPLIFGLEALVPADAWLFNRADVPQSSPLQP